MAFDWNRKLRVVRGSEYTIFFEDRILLLGSGTEKSIIRNLVNDISTIEMVKGGDGDKNDVLYYGSAGDVAREFERLACHLKGRRRWIGSKIAIGAAIVIIALVSFEAGRLTASVVAAPQVSELSSQFPHLSELVQNGGIPDDGKLPKLPPSLSIPNASPNAAMPNHAATETSSPELKVLKRPDFLDVTPGAASKPKSSPETAEKPKPAADASELKSDQSLPEYRPDLYQDPKDQASKPSSEGASSVSAPPTPENPKPTATLTETPKPMSDKETPAAEASPEEMKKGATAVIDGLRKKGMTDADARSLLLQLQQLQAAGQDAITPEMIKSLPEDVAQLLATQGQGRDLEGESGGKMRILPSSVVDRYRGKDGVATIPENFSWYARSGGPISIPLPGGGDIKTPDDMKEFGWKP